MIAGARGGAPALEEHFVDGSHGEEVAFEGEGTIGKGAVTGLGLVAVGVETVAQDEGAREDVEVSQGGLGIADTCAKGGHPGEAVTAPGAGSESVPLCQRSAR
jgi:hypothetical protein